MTSRSPLDIEGRAKPRRDFSQHMLDIGVDCAVSKSDPRQRDLFPAGIEESRRVAHAGDFTAFATPWLESAGLI